MNDPADNHKEDPDNEVDSLICNIPDINDENIIANIFEDTSRIYIVLESQDTLKISQECLSEYTVDSAAWSVEVLFSDSTSRNYPFLGNEFLIDPDSVILNPSGWAPLTAVIHFNLPVSRTIRINIAPKGRNSSHISNNFGEFKRSHQLPVFGLYPDYTNKVKVELLDYFGNPVLSKSIEIKTEPVIRAQSGEMAVIQNNLNDDQRNRLFLIQNTIYDGAGDIRWYTTHGGQKFYALSGGLIGIQPFPDKGWIKEGPDIKIINYLGEITDTFDVPNRMHHEINEKTPGGNLLVATNAEEYFTTDDDTEDMIIEIDRSTGEVLKEWDLRNIFDPERPRIWTENVNDWCHLNSIEYDPQDNSLLISSKLQYFVSKIDYDTGEILWICGNHENWKEPWQDYLLNPLNFDTTEHVDHDWTYAQHMPRITGDGTFIVYDNGVERPGSDYTRAVEYRVDKANMTVEKIWTYNMNNAARTMGSVYVYDDNTVQIGHAKNGEIYIVTRGNNILFQGKLLTYYRAYPISLY